MDPDGILVASAEIAIAIAGFSGIVLAIGPRRLSELRDGARLVLSVLILVTASTVVFAFLPLLLSSAGISEAVLWRSASSIYAIYLACIATYRAVQHRRLAAEDRPSGSFVLLPVLAMSALALQVANAVWLVTAWPYLTAIVMLNAAGLAVFSHLLGRFGSES